jgi:hypothetical protein
MKDLETCLDELGDEQYIHSGTLVDLVDQDVFETCVAGMYKSFKLKDDKSINTFARSLMQQLDEKMNERAEAMSINSRSLFDEPVTEFDVRKYA